MSYSPITTGYTLPARTNQGGIKAIYVGLFQTNPAMTFTVGTNSVTAVGGATVSFFTVAQRQEIGGATVKANNNMSGVTSYDGNISVTVEAPDNTMSNWIEILQQGIWRCIALDSLGQYWLYGFENGMYCSADGGPGKAVLDGHKYVLTFTGKERHLPYLITSAVAQSLIV